MIVINDHTMINPAIIAAVYIEKNSYRGYDVRLAVLGTNGTYNITSKHFETEAEADLFMDYCCEEIDKANGVYKEVKDNTEDSIC